MKLTFKLSLAGLRRFFLVLLIVFVSGSVGYLIGNKNFRPNSKESVRIDRTVPADKPLEFSLFWQVWDDLNRLYVDRINLNSTKGIIPLIKSFEGAKTFKDEGFGFSNVIIDESKRLIVLKFDEKNIKNKNIKQIILEGYIKKNMSELDYLYEDNSRYGEVCNEKECNLKININNSLNLPVYQYEDESLILFDYSKIENKSNCKFNEVTYDFNPKNNIRVNPSCDGNSCEIRGWDTNLKKEVFFINLYIDGKVVKSSHIWMNIPINVNANFNLVC